jgi:predicted peptidase
MRDVYLVSLALLFVLSLTAFAQKKFDPGKVMEKRTFKKDKSSLQYRLFIPEGYKDSKESYPLVVFLHGAGERGDDNTAQLVHGVADFVNPDSQKKRPCFVIAPQCPNDEVWVWGLIPKLEKKSKKPAVEAGDLVPLLVEVLCKEYRIDKKRIYLTGLSMGGFGTWELMCRNPNLFAAGVPICGGGHTSQADRIAKIPIWCFHGEKDGIVPVKDSRAMIDAVKKAGGKPKYTEYKGVDHDSWTQTYRDVKVHEWLFEQKKE